MSPVFSTGDGATGAPKWSWLSFPGMVYWPTRHRSMQPALEIVDAISAEVLEEIPQVVAMFTRLKVRAKMRPVLVRGKMAERNKLEKVVKATGVQVYENIVVSAFRAVRRERYYVICSPTTPEIAGGWRLLKACRSRRSLGRTPKW
jgi:hypothetical protein